MIHNYSYDTSFIIFYTLYIIFYILSYFMKYQVSNKLGLLLQ